jgi:hypothetical protein
MHEQFAYSSQCREQLSTQELFEREGLCHKIEARHSFFCSSSVNEAEYPVDVALCFLSIMTGSLLLLLTLVIVTE